MGNHIEVIPNFDPYNNSSDKDQDFYKSRFNVLVNVEKFTGNLPISDLVRRV